MGGGQLVALFGYTNLGSAPIRPMTNVVSINGTQVNPQPGPPSLFPPGDYPGIFLPTFNTGQTIVWTVDGLSVTASATSPHLMPVQIGQTGLGVKVGSTLVTLRGDVPPDPGKMDGPPVGPVFNGALTGQFAVNPSGAATYTVPISIPPGIAGMAPNLALSYSSQGADGIAGEGWSLTGLSMISRCPKTRQQDGIGRPVMMDSLTPSDNPDGLSDGICLDGKKLFELSPPGSGNYVGEAQDFSTITRSGTQFQVVTKAGETRYYGRLDSSNVKNPQNGETAIWLLDRVVDHWGNYFDVHYNNDQGSQPVTLSGFTASGIWVSEIDYTGTLTNSDCNDDSPPSSCTFASVTFQYECRPDTRWTRVGPLKIPQSQRLKSVTTTHGTYSLTYVTPAPTNPFQGTACSVGAVRASLDRTQLSSIGYCAGSTCMKPVTFGWENPQGNWKPSSGYTLPTTWINPGLGLKGTQFVDINGDGRPDFLVARTNSIRTTLMNTGQGWGPPVTGRDLAFPADLSDANGNPTSARFADLDGDGLLDLIIDSANVACDSDGHNCVSCPVGSQCSGSTHYQPAVWLNRTRVNSGGWQFAPSYAGPNVTFNADPGWMVADVDGDGRADLIQVIATILGGVTMNVQLNTTNAQGAQIWVAQTSPSNPSYHSDSPDLLGQPFQLEDVNRDGLVDLVRDKFVSVRRTA